MPTNPVHGTAAAGGVAGAFTALLVWLLAQVHVAMPPDVAIAVGVLLTAAAGAVIHQPPRSLIDALDEVLRAAAPPAALPSVLPTPRAARSTAAPVDAAPAAGD